MQNRERGMMSFKALLSLAVLGALVYLAYMLVPHVVRNYQLQDDITTIARFSSYAQNKTEEDIRQEVIVKGRANEILLTPENVTVQKTGTSVNIDIKYTVHVELPGYPLDLRFNPTAGNKIITAQ